MKTQLIKTTVTTLNINPPLSPRHIPLLIVIVIGISQAWYVTK